MSSIENLKKSILATVNELVPLNNHFAARFGMDLRDDDYHEALEIIARLERKIKSKLPSTKG